MQEQENLSPSAQRLAREKIRPIVELFPVDWRHDGAWFLDKSKEDHNLLISILKNHKGIYSFYNSEAEIIYLGKTKNNLWTEMKSAYSREMGHYQRFFGDHYRTERSSGEFRAVYRHLKNDVTPKITPMSMKVSEAAFYFSAYSIDDDDWIDVIEMLFLRLAPNDLVNRRIEGNTTLQAITV